jgi:hypothetical protein
MSSPVGKVIVESLHEFYDRLVTELADGDGR